LHLNLFAGISNRFYMANFNYKASDIKGNVIEGSMDAREEKSVAQRLQEKGYIPIRIASVEETTEDVSELISSPDIFNRISQQEVITFTQELAGLLRAGIPFDRSFKTLIGLVENNRFKEILRGILKMVEEGSSVAIAMEKFPQVFSKFYVSLIRAGEASGALDTTLTRLSEYLSRSKELNKHIVTALIYPIILTTLGGLSVIILLTFVVPQFASTFSDLGEALPTATLVLLKISELVRGYWWIFCLALLALYTMWRLYTNTPSGRMFWDSLKLKIPGIGRIIRKAEVVRFSRTLGTLLAGGVSLLNSLDIVGDVMTNRSIAKSIKDIQLKVTHGEGLGKPMQNEEIFPPMAVEMIAVGEETGRLDQMLLEVANNFDEQVKENAKRFLALLEPVLILVMGIIVGSIVVSMLLAIFSVNELPF